MGKKWSKDEDELLRSSVGRIGKDQTINWIKISGMIQGRTNKDCRKRWTKISSAQRTGSWNQQEDSILKLAIESVGTRWMVVSKIVGTCTPDQCQKRWQNALKPELCNADWTTAEDDRLTAAVKTHGRNWASISNNCFKHRSALNLSNRYALLCRDIKQNATSKSEGLPSPVLTDSAFSATSLDMPLYSPAFAASQHEEINLASDPHLGPRVRNFVDFEAGWHPCHQAQMPVENPPLPDHMDNILISPSSGGSSPGLAPPWLQYMADGGVNHQNENFNSIPPVAPLGQNVYDAWLQPCSNGTTPKSTVAGIPQGTEYAVVKSRDGTADGRITLLLENVDQDTRDEILGLLCRRKGNTVIKVDMMTK